MQSDIDKELDLLYDYVQELSDSIEKQVIYSELRLLEMEIESDRKRKLSKNNLCKMIIDKFKKEK